MILTGVIWSARTVWFSLVIIKIVDKDIFHINHDEENTVWSLTSETRTRTRITQNIVRSWTLTLEMKSHSSSRRLRKTSSGHDRPGGQRCSLRGLRRTSSGRNWRLRRSHILRGLHREHRLVMTDLGDDVIVHADWAEHRLVMIDLGEDVIVHANWAEHRLIMIDFEENVQVHVDYVKNVVWSWQFSEMTASST